MSMWTQFALTAFANLFFMGGALPAQPASLSIGLLTASRGVWTPGTTYSVGDTIVPVNWNGHIFRCTTAGTSGVIEPTWPLAYGATVPDGAGALVWTEQTLRLQSGLIDQEVTGGSYARVTYNSNTSNWGFLGGILLPDSVLQTLAGISFPAPTAGWGLIAGFFFMAGSNMILFGTLPLPTQVNNGDPAFGFPLNNIRIQLDT